MILPELLRVLSIDDLVGHETPQRMEAFLADPKAGNQVQRIHEIEIMRLVRQALASLPERERHIIRHRFGLQGGQEQTLEQIGQGLSLSRERVRQLEREAKHKLRAKLFCHRAELV